MLTGSDTFTVPAVSVGPVKAARAFWTTDVRATHEFREVKSAQTT